MHRLKFKILFLTLGSLLAVALFFSAWGLYVLRGRMEYEFSLRSLALARTFANVVSANFNPGSDNHLIQQYLDSQAANADVEEARLLDAQGRSVMGKWRGDMSKESEFRQDAPELFAKALGALTPQIETRKQAGVRYLLIYQRAWKETEIGITTSGVCFLKMSYYRLDRELHHTAALFLGAMGLFVLCAGVLAYFLSDAITRPIEQFREAAEAIRGGDFSRPLPLRAVDEIGELARSFQAMAADVQNTQQNLAGLVRERTTELERSHEQLRQSEKMSAVGQLAAGVAHEINNPVGIILGFAQSMVKKMPEADPLTHALKSIEREAIRARDLVQNLMTFSRQSKGAFEQMDFNAVVAQTLSIVEAKARVKSVEVVRELGSIEPLWGDKSRLQQVIVNLCGNALDAMPGGGKMTVRTKGAASGTEKQVVLEVEDTGAGIPKEIQDKIFEPFFTTKEVGQGAGLGLSFVYEIVQAHKGTIRVDSEAGKGAKFTIALPIRPPQTAAGPAARMPSARGQS